MLYLFADFELDEGRFELRRQGTIVPVQPKVLRMLLHLIAQRARAVGNDELFRVLWPGEHVGTASIKRAVIGARRALGEVGDSQESIRTVRGLGYRFVAQVQSSTSLEPTDVVPSPALVPEATLGAVDGGFDRLCAALAARVLREAKELAQRDAALSPAGREARVFWRTSSSDSTPRSQPARWNACT